MKWVLIWIAIAGSGGISSGSAEFASSKGCEAGRKALQDTLGGMKDELHTQTLMMVRSQCVEDQGSK